MHRTFFHRLSCAAPAVLSAVLAGGLGWGAVASAQSTNQGSAPTTDQTQPQTQAQDPAQVQTSAPAVKPMPDAQVEAGVLKGLAGAPDLANQQITTSTVYGVVTLSGSVETEAERVEAETIASKTRGVQKVVDEMTLSGENAQPPQGTDAQGAPANSPEDANMAPAQTAQQSAPVVQGSPDTDNTEPNQAGGPNYGPSAPGVRQPYGSQSAPPRGYAPGYNGYAQQPIYGGQEAGIAVTVPTGSLLRMRINQTLTSASAKPGDEFDGIVVSDVVAGGVVAIPRGAAVHGTVVNAKKAGALVGRGELSLQLTQLMLGGKVYPIVSDVWGHNGGDKTVQTVNNTAVGGAIGALFGAAAAGGKGAAIGAGVGGALGLGSSAASGNGQIFIPSEGLLSFHLTQPTAVATVSQAEMDRLAQGVPQPVQRLQRRYPPPYYGPVYYRPYPYPY